MTVIARCLLVAIPAVLGAGTAVATDTARSQPATQTRADVSARSLARDLPARPSRSVRAPIPVPDIEDIRDASRQRARLAADHARQQAHTQAAQRPQEAPNSPPPAASTEDTTTPASDAQAQPGAQPLDQPPALPAGAPADWVNGVGACIRHYESRGNYQAVSPNGRWFGAYQFDLQTWGSVGGAGNPAAAAPAEQDYRAWLLWQAHGLSPWPTPARRC